MMRGENIYGHGKRLEWLRARLRREDRVAEMGCGTGYMITLPLALEGYDILGVDPDGESIRRGREIFRKAGVDPGLLREGGLGEVAGFLDAVIASEVLEHLTDEQMPGALAAVRAKLRPGGKFLVTVPNGWGWFELESFLWFRAGLGRLLGRLRLDALLRRGALFLGAGEEDSTPSTCSPSAHRQRFTLRSVRRMLEREGFRVVECAGSVLFAGPLSNLLLGGFGPVMRLNRVLGEKLPRLAAGFYLDCRVGAPGGGPGREAHV